MGISKKAQKLILDLTNEERTQVLLELYADQENKLRSLALHQLETTINNMRK